MQQTTDIYELWLDQVRAALKSVNMTFDDWQKVWSFDFRKAFEAGIAANEAAMNANKFWWLENHVLLNPETNEPLSRPRLYQRMVALGTRAGVSNAHPHRFRDTLAVDMLLRGATPYDFAKTLGDTIETVEKHYAPFVKALRDRVRAILEAEGGLEQPETHTRVTPASQLPTRTM